MGNGQDRQQRNVFGGPLESCSIKPMTGFFRDGCCNTSADDFGAHVVCVEITESFLQFSQRQGNDLKTPNKQAGFPGLKAGDRWCICATRWHEAFEAGCAPNLFLSATNEKILDLVSLETLSKFALDLI